MQAQSSDIFKWGLEILTDRVGPNFGYRLRTSSPSGKERGGITTAIRFGERRLIRGRCGAGESRSASRYRLLDFAGWNDMDLPLPATSPSRCNIPLSDMRSQPETASRNSVDDIFRAIESLGLDCQPRHASAASAPLIRALFRSGP